MKKLLFFAIVLILVMSLVPLSGVSAQRPAPASSANSAPAARATEHKDIKTQLVMYCYGAKCFKFVQKVGWDYDYSTVLGSLSLQKGVIFQSSWAFDGVNPIAVLGGFHKPYLFFWGEGAFYKASTGKYVYLNIQQQVFPDGTWWAEKFYYKG